MVEVARSNRGMVRQSRGRWVTEIDRGEKGMEGGLCGSVLFLYQSFWTSLRLIRMSMSVEEHRSAVGLVDMRVVKGGGEEVGTWNRQQGESLIRGSKT